MHLPNLSALALQKNIDEDFWRRERKADRQRSQKRQEAQAARDSDERKVPGQERGLLSIRLRNGAKAARTEQEQATVEKLIERNSDLRKDTHCVGWRLEGQEEAVSGARGRSI